jgi:glucose-6-phosphate dehydrogenase assembly protein OpcA
MATSYKVLGQIKPSANTLTTAYTVPSSTEAVVSTIVVTNLGSASTTYRVAIQKDGASISQEMYLAYDISIPSLDSLALTLGVTLNAADVISVESFSGLVNFNIFGSEIA